jgi:hypothetical protein
VPLHEASLDVADLVAPRLHTQHGRRVEDGVQLEEVLAAVELLAPRAQAEQPVRLEEDVAAHHRVDQRAQLVVADAAERIRRAHPVEHAVARQAALLQRQRHHLVSQDVHRVLRRPDIFDPAAVGEPRHRHRLQHRLGAGAEERAVGAPALAAPGATHALQHRRDGGRGVDLQDLVEVTDVDAQLHGRRAHDRGVLAVRELQLRVFALLAAHRAVVDEHLDAAAGHRLRDPLGARPALDEHQALLAAPELGDAAGGLVDAAADVDRQVARRRALGWVDQPERARARALHPLADHLGVTDRRRQPDALDVAADEHRDALEQRRQVRAAVVAGERVDLVDHHRLQPGQERARVGPLADHHDLQRLRRGHQHVAGELPERLLARV